MATGIRIRHSSERNALMVVVDPSRRYREPLLCLPCRTTHQFKTYHLQLDDAGTVIVSREIWTRLVALAVNPFALANAVAEPPPQTLIIPRLSMKLRALAP